MIYLLIIQYMHDSFHHALTLDRLRPPRCALPAGRGRFKPFSLREKGGDEGQNRQLFTEILIISRFT